MTTVTGPPGWIVEAVMAGPFLAVAAATGSILVTGNVRHFPARARHGVRVQTPRELVDSLR